MGVFKQLKQYLDTKPGVKATVGRLISAHGGARPRTWVRLFVNPFIHQVSSAASIRRGARLDVFPFQPFIVGKEAIIEDFATINNGMGPVVLGDRSLVGIGCIIIGPVTLGADVLLAQHVVISALNHRFNDVTKPIRAQGVEFSSVSVGEGSWIGANVVITAGVHIGRNCVIGAGSVVTHDVPDFSVAVGNPARVVKQYDQQTKNWQAVTYEHKA